MTGVFNDFYDEVDYEEKSGDKDISGQDIYLEPIKLKARHVGGTHNLKINEDTIIRIYTDEYQLPEEVSEGDKINSHIVTDVIAVRNVFGDLEYYIARVE